jgi:uncharacterized membrane protein
VTETLSAETLSVDSGSDARSLHVTRVVWAGAAVYAIVLSFVSWLRYEAFLPEGDLGVFGQLVWLLGHLDEPFSSVALRPMLGDHWEPALGLLAPLGTLGIGTVGILIVQAAVLGAIAPALLALARLSGATGWVAAVVPLLWLCSPVVVRANLWDFHPDVFVAALLVLSVYAILSRKTLLFVVCVVVACGFKEDVGLTFAALGVALIWVGFRRVGTVLAMSAASLAVFLNLILMPWLWPGGRSLYTQRFVGDRGTGFGDAVRFWVTNPLETISDALTTPNLRILAILIAMTAGLCLLAPRWLVVAVPTVALNLLSAYEGQHTLKYQYWLVPGAAVALAGAIGSGKIGGRWSAATCRGALVAGVGLLALTSVAVGHVLGDVRNEWSQRADRHAIVAAIPADASVASPLRFLSHLAERHDLFVFPVPFVDAVPESEWSPTQIAAARETLDYVIFDPTLTRNPETLKDVEQLGFVPVLRRGTTTLYRAPPARP